MKLIPLRNDNVHLAASWLAERENYQWLEFGDGLTTLSQVHLKVMSRRESHFIRLFTSEDDIAIGIVALSDINDRYGTAMLWYLLGDKDFSRQGLTTSAVSKLLAQGFGPLKLNAIWAWVVEGNLASKKILERNGFNFFGRRRRCHVIDGHHFDRFYYDLLAEEFRRGTSVLNQP